MECEIAPFNSLAELVGSLLLDLLIAKNNCRMHGAVAHIYNTYNTHIANSILFTPRKAQL